MSTPPDIGKALSVKVDAQLYDDLETMLRTGMTVSDAVRTAMLIVAGTYRQAWETERCPDAVRPTITTYLITRYDAGQEPERGSVQRDAPTPYRERPTPRPTITPDRPTPRPQRPTSVRQASSWPLPD